MSTGDAAEDWFSHLASLAGFTINKSQRDRAGWDHIVDLTIPRPPSPNDPLGLPTEVLSGRIQVKEVRGRFGRRSIPIKLSNWRIALADPLPWFFVVITMRADSDGPGEIAVVHLDCARIEKVLRRLYSLDDKQLISLNRQTLSLTWSSEDVLAVPQSETLRAFISSAVPGSLHDYAATKKKWVDCVGFAATRKQQFTIRLSGASPDEVFERLSMAVVGLEQNISVQLTSWKHERFGVMHVDRRFRQPQMGTLSIPSVRGGATFRLHLLNGFSSRVASFDVAFRSSAMVIPDLPEKHWISRLEGHYFEMVIYHAISRITFNLKLPDETQQIEICSLLDALELWRAFDARGSEKMRMQVEKNGQPGFSIPLTRVAQLDDSFRSLYESATRMARLVRRLGAPDDCRLSLRQIVDDGLRVRFMLAALDEEVRSSVRLEFDFHVDNFVSGAPVAIIIDPVLIVGGIAYMQLVAITGSLVATSSSDGQARAQITSDTYIALKTIRCSPDEIAHFDVAGAVEEEEIRLKREGVSEVYVLRLEPERRSVL